jgi:hypothetical protein
LTLDGKKISEVGLGFVQALVLRRPRQSHFNIENIENHQSTTGFEGIWLLSGPVDETVNQLTREALRWLNNRGSSV